MKRRMSSGVRRVAAVGIVAIAAVGSAAPEGAGLVGCDRAELREPVRDPEAAARAFRLFYRERAERAVLAYNRFALFGDTGFGTTIGNKAVAKSGDAYEVVPHPTDNNLIGTTVWASYHALKAIPSRTLALSLIRLFDGLAFFEAVPGVPGLSSREVLPGWTRVMDGIGHTVERTRDGAPVAHPNPPSASLEAEILATFYDGVRVTYRENPSDFMFNLEPALTLGEYALTFSFDERPRYARVSNCCSSFMQVPPGYPWEGAWWGNHNSRDNHPDMGIGFVAALAAMNDPDLDDDVRAAAARAVEAGRRIGDFIQTNEQNAMTIDEFHDYGDLTVAGARRPHGDPENQDLGSMASCQTAYLMRAISSEGLDLPLPSLPLPGEIEEFLLSDLLGIDLDLPLVYCGDLDQAYFGLPFATVFEQDFLGLPLIDFITLLDILSPGIAQEILGGFQDDYAELVQATLGTVEYARTTANAALEDAARTALGSQTHLMRRFADAIFARTNPARQAEQRYEASLLAALGGIPPIAADLGDFSTAEARIAALEGMLAMGDTAPAPLLTDEEILARAEATVAGEKLESIVQRYRDTYGMTPPVRRAGDGYEARTSVDPTWRPVERPHHRRFGSHRLLLEIPLCTHAPDVLECGWADLGCGVADLDRSGVVDEADRALFDAARAYFHGIRAKFCRPGNDWCDGADLDRTGDVTALDLRFMDAAMGCRTGG